MNLTERFPVSAGKIDAVLKKIKALNLQPHLIEESFSRGSGKGGQKVNKTSNAVTLIYPPLHLLVKVHRERSRSLNRFLALRELVEQAEIKLAPENSVRMIRVVKAKKQKDRRRRRSASSALLPADLWKGDSE